MFPAVTADNFSTVHALANRYPTFDTVEEETVAISKAQSGCMDSMKSVVLSYLRVVTYQVMDLKRNWEECPDLFQIGCEALLIAVNKFDASLCVRLFELAKIRIRSAIVEYFHTNSRQMKLWTTKPLKKLLNNQFKYDYECPVDRQRALSELEVSNKDVDAFIERNGVSTFSDSINENGEVTCAYEEVVASEYDNSPYVTKSKMEQVRELLRICTPRQQEVLNMHMFQNMTQDVISRELGISNQRVSEIIKEGVARMNKAVNEG
ncbi:RNA polymerase sigma-70 like domain protein [Vibrio phage 1.031.O._10N.261.46.F8]|nr:RNA polymerase sigma-70 like domain protein [Vibrio phage 1.031.O._10N.261.46.F8]